jgi:chromate reductase
MKRITPRLPGTVFRGDRPESGASAPRRVLVIAGSTRTSSINHALAREITTEFGVHGRSATLVDLTEFPMPLYDGDLEERDGVPQTAIALAETISASDVLVLVSPEYNGAFTPLLKNTVDWLTRVDHSILGHLTVLVAAASPGAGGGANAIEMLRAWMQNMNISVAEHALPVGSASLGECGRIIGLDRTELAAFVTQTALDPAA